MDYKDYVRMLLFLEDKGTINSKNHGRDREGYADDLQPAVISDRLLCRKNGSGHGV